MNKPSPPRSNPLFQEAGYSRPLDGLRGLAILLVLLFHNFDYLHIFSFGWIGVDIFFVLSGFLITTTFLKNLDSPRPILLFYTKRILRIFPLYYLSLILLLFVLPLFAHAPAYRLSPSFRPWFWFFLENWLYVFKKVPPFEGQHLRHFWSLALEEQYYLVWPWVLLLVKKPRNMIRIVLCTLGILFVVRFIVWNTAGKEFIYYFFVGSRIEGLCVGSLLAIATWFKLPDTVKRLSTAFWGTLAGCLAILLLKQFQVIDLPFFGLGGYLLISIAVAALILYTARAPQHFILSHPLLVHMGKVSFGLYIFHWPLYFILNKPIGYFLFSHMDRLSVQESTLLPIPYRIASSIICMLLAGLLAYGSYYGYEIYFLRLKKRLSFSREPRNFHPTAPK